MQSNARGLRLAVTALAVGLVSMSSQVSAAVNSGSTGVDGALNPVTSVDLPLPEDGVLNYTSVTIPKGVTVTFRRNKRNTPVHMLVSGDVKIYGVLDLRGKDAKPTGTYLDGVLGDDGEPGAGGPGGFDGGRGGRDDAASRPEIINGGPGLGPGGGPAGVWIASGWCTALTSPYSNTPGYGGGAGHTEAAYRNGTSGCGALTNVGPQFYGKSYGSDFLQPLIGGSGGGGGRGGTKYGGSGGGGGGGAILIAANGTILIDTDGWIDTTGGDGGGAQGDANGWSGAGGSGWAGAGGSGGSIRLVASRVEGAGVLAANGGCVNKGGGRRYCASSASAWQGGSGGSDPYYNAGSYGRIRIEADAITFSGISQPNFVKGLPGPIFLGSAPRLRIASVAGVDVPLEPTGTADVNLPAPPSEPVQVILKTANVPLGSKVILRVAPAYGDAAEVIGTVAGSDADGAVSVLVTIPSGPSSLTASATFDVKVPVAAAAALSRYASNEKVDHVELTIALQGEPQAKLVTSSGRRIEVSCAVLRAAGVTV